MDDFKPRDQHAGPSTPHIGQSHLEKDTLEKQARKIDQGPNFGTPGDPPSANPDSIAKIEKSFDDLNGEDGVPRAG
jgi:hypothetical protein